MGDVKVTHIPGTYSKGGKQYGPFTATPEKPYIEVPLGIQMTQNLPLYDEDAAEAEAAEGQSLLEANASLKADLDQAIQERDAARAELGTAQREGNEAQADAATLRQQLAEAQARALPADALERIKKVSGVADKYGQPILDALTAPAAEEPAQ